MADCTHWVAWLNERSRQRRSLHVRGTCTVRGPGHSVTLERWTPHSGATATDGASIHGSTVRSRRESPPEFRVDPGPDRCYGIEFATSAHLLDRDSHADERSSINYYATWRNGPLLDAATYALPEAVWDRLVRARPQVDSLFYRLWTSESATAWQSVTTTTPNGEEQNAPLVLITEEVVDGLDDPGVLTLHRTLRVPHRLGPLEARTTVVSYVEHDAPNYTAVLILPCGVRVEVETVY